MLGASINQPPAITEGVLADVMAGGGADPRRFQRRRENDVARRSVTTRGCTPLSRSNRDDTVQLTDPSDYRPLSADQNIGNQLLLNILTSFPLRLRTALVSVQKE